MKGINEVYESLIYVIKKTNEKCFSNIYRYTSKIKKDYYKFLTTTNKPVKLFVIVTKEEDDNFNNWINHFDISTFILGDI